MSHTKKTVHIVGAGLAGSECAWQLAQAGFSVILYEMRGDTMTPAHKTDSCAELVCSNSLGNLGEFTAPGQLKWEAEKFNSLILSCAKAAQVPAGMALAVDRDQFSRLVTQHLTEHVNIRLERKVIHGLDDLPRPLVIATGPLTHDDLAQDLARHLGQHHLYFFDAIAPIIDADTIDMEVVWRQDRWDKGTGDYLNCPFDKEHYYAFVNEIKAARKIEPRDFEKTPYFEGCMPVEAIVERGVDTLRFGPMKPKGLSNPRTGRMPFAVVQLRQENRAATAYNMVGFQTKMAYPEQKRVFRMIPGLEKAEFLKLGSMHRNLYINTPRSLNADLSSRHDPLLFFAGQITGVEGYFESTCMGLVVAQALQAKLSQRPWQPPPPHTALGALLAAITDRERAHFQPTNINFGLFPPLSPGVRIDKSARKEQTIKAAQHFFTNPST